METTGRLDPVVRLDGKRMSCDEWIEVLEVRLDRKRLYVEHVKRVRDRMSEVVKKITGFCRNKGRMGKDKIRAIMVRVVLPAVLYDSEI